ncbi:hypothetical protein, partial [Serratia marcescens]|uniref:hypothetical protein n=1 Tax=Serratia marcescens TaxID=615 RepID=UPI001953077D
SEMSSIALAMGSDMLYTAQRAIYHKKRFKKLAVITLILFILFLVHPISMYLGFFTLIFTLE